MPLLKIFGWLWSEGAKANWWESGIADARGPSLKSALSISHKSGGALDTVVGARVWRPLCHGVNLILVCCVDFWGAIAVATEEVFVTLKNHIFTYLVLCVWLCLKRVDLGMPPATTRLPRAETLLLLWSFDVLRVNYVDIWRLGVLSIWFFFMGREFVGIAHWESFWLRSWLLGVLNVRFILFHALRVSEGGLLQLRKIFEVILRYLWWVQLLGEFTPRYGWRGLFSHCVQFWSSLSIRWLVVISRLLTEDIEVWCEAIRKLWLLSCILKEAAAVINIYSDWRNIFLAK